MVLSVRHLLRNPLLAPVAARSAQEISAAAAREMARVATPEHVDARLRTLLAERPRDWLAIDAVLGVARERGIALPADLIAASDAARAEDVSYLAQARACVTCALDPASCPLSSTLLCQAPMTLTPLGDVAGVSTEAWHTAIGTPVDRLNLTLSVVGLGSTLLAVPTDGAGAFLGVGANLFRLAHRMKLLTRPMGELLLRAGRDGVNWARLQAVSLRDLASGGLSAGTLRGFLRPQAFAPAVEVVEDLGRIRTASGSLEALYLLRYIDDEKDAARLAKASEALGPKVAGRMEILGKSRLLRLTTRLTRFAVGAVASLIGFIYALGMILAHGLHHLLLRRLRRAVRDRAR